MRTFLFIVAFIWGGVMQMGYTQLLDNPNLSDQTIGYATMLFYLIAAVSLIAAFLAGEGPLIGYILGLLFVRAYRQQRRHNAE